MKKNYNNDIEISDMKFKLFAIGYLTGFISALIIIFGIMH